MTLTPQSVKRSAGPLVEPVEARDDSEERRNIDRHEDAKHDAFHGAAFGSGGRGVKERPILMSAPMVRAILEDKKSQTRRVVKEPDQHNLYEGVAIRCPHGQPGDRLWVREAFALHLCCGEEREILHYAADGESCPNDGERIRRWTPSIYMPRWASRITLEIVAVRVERLNSISREDAVAEGITPIDERGERRNCVIEFANLWDSINDKRFGWDANPWVWRIKFVRTT